MESGDQNTANVSSNIGGSGPDFDLGLLMLIVQRTILWGVLIIGLALIGAYTFIHYTQPVYQSFAVMQITSENQANTLLNVQDIYESGDLSKDLELLRSQEFFKRVIASLPLEVSYYSEGEVLTTELFRNSHYQVDFEVKDPIIYDTRIYIQIQDSTEGTINYSIRNEPFEYSFAFGDTLETPHATLVFQDRFVMNMIENVAEESVYYFTLNSPVANLKRIYPNYSVQILNNSAKTVQISILDNNTAKATAICNQITEEFLEFDKERKKESAKQILKFIDGQLGDVYTRLKDSETLIKDFKKVNRMGDDASFANTYLARLEDAEIEYNRIELQRELLRSLKRNINEENTGVDINQLLPVLAGSDVEQTVQQQIMSLQALVHRRNLQLGSATLENPTIQIYDQQIESQKTLILRSLDALETKMNSAIQRLQAKINEIDQNFLDLPTKEIEYARLERVFNSNEKYYTLLLEKKTEYAISEAGFISENTVLQKATTPRVPVSPKKSLIYSTTVSLAALLILLIIAIRYLMNNDISNTQDLGRLLHPQVSLLGVIPKYQRNIPLSQLIVDKRPKSIMAESFRSLRSNLEFFESNDEKKVIAVTSTISGEGKTFVAINLGGILAYSGKRVIILDLDMRRPRIHKGFSSTNEYGMSTFLSNRDALANTIRKSELKDLHFITAGPIPPNPSELIINGRLTKAIAELKNDYDVIIIDNPPVGLVTDGITSLKLADYPIYIFRSEYSKKNFVNNVNRLFVESKIKNLSVVLNSLNLDRVKYGSYGKNYGYGYGYGGYGYGYGYGYTSSGGYYDDGDKNDKKGFLRNLSSKSKNDSKGDET